MPPILTKRACRNCRKPRPLASFPALHPDGELHPFCRPCLSLKVRQHDRQRRRDQTEAKVCALCAQRLPLDRFHWIKSSETHHSYCRGCHSVYMAERYRRRRRGSALTQ
jgi:hypothetical protein